MYVSRVLRLYTETFWLLLILLFVIERDYCSCIGGGGLATSRVLIRICWFHKLTIKDLVVGWSQPQYYNLVIPRLTESGHAISPLYSEILTSYYIRIAEHDIRISYVLVLIKTMKIPLFYG